VTTDDGKRDAFGAALRTVEAAAERDISLRLIGGQGVRYLTPEFPPRARDDQDMDFASVSRTSGDLLRFFSDLGFSADERFNALHGRSQMFFSTPDGRTSVDVVMDELRMCHVLDFRERIDRQPHTLDVVDLLLSKLQVVELNAKDAHDIVYLLAAFQVREGDEVGTIGLGRFGEVLGGDWGWWRTVTANLDAMAEDLASGRIQGPEGARFDPEEQARRLRAHADAVPKSLRWKLRARIGDRVRWYELPEEVAH